MGVCIAGLIVWSFCNDLKKAWKLCFDKQSIKPVIISKRKIILKRQ